MTYPLASPRFSGERLCPPHGSPHRKVIRGTTTGGTGSPDNSSHRGPDGQGLSTPDGHGLFRPSGCGELLALVWPGSGDAGSWTTPRVAGSCCSPVTRDQHDRLVCRARRMGRMQRQERTNKSPPDNQSGGAPHCPRDIPPACLARADAGLPVLPCRAGPPFDTGCARIDGGRLHLAPATDMPSHRLYGLPDGGWAKGQGNS